MSYLTCEKTEMDGIPVHTSLPRQKSNNRWTKFFAASLTILLLYMSVSAILNVQKIQAISNQISLKLDGTVTSIQVDKRDVAVNTSLELVPHPVYYNVQTLPMMYPNTTAVSNATMHERASLWWALGGAWNVGMTGYAMWQMAKSCQAWYQNGTPDTEATTIAGCVVGAVSTLLVVAGAGWAVANWGAAVGLALKLYQTLPKRDVSFPDYAELLIDYQTFMVNTTGLAMAPMFNELGDLMLHNKSGMPLMFGYNPRGDGMLFTHKFDADTNKTYMAYGFVPPPSAVSKRDVFYNEEDFTSGGLEAGFSFNQASDGGYLNVENDYGQMDHEVSCLFGNLANNDLEFQIYDNNHHGTIAGGNVRAYQSGEFDLGDLKDPVDAPLPDPAACQVA